MHGKIHGNVIKTVSSKRPSNAVYILLLLSNQSTYNFLRLDGAKHLIKGK
jgi:hypothetical protein